MFIFVLFCFFDDDNNSDLDHLEMITPSMIVLPYASTTLINYTTINQSSMHLYLSIYLSIYIFLSIYFYLSIVLNMETRLMLITYTDIPYIPIASLSCFTSTLFCFLAIFRFVLLCRFFTTNIAFHVRCVCCFQWWCWWWW